MDQATLPAGGRDHFHHATVNCADNLDQVVQSRPRFFSDLGFLQNFDHRRGEIMRVRMTSCAQLNVSREYHETSWLIVRHRTEERCVWIRDPTILKSE